MIIIHPHMTRLMAHIQIVPHLSEDALEAVGDRWCVHFFSPKGSKVPEVCMWCSMHGVCMWCSMGGVCMWCSMGGVCMWCCMSCSYVVVHA